MPAALSRIPIGRTIILLGVVALVYVSTVSDVSAWYTNHWLLDAECALLGCLVVNIYQTMWPRRK